MPLIVNKDNYLENNSWAISDLKTAREMIDVIIRDLEDNGQTHINYVFEKLGRAENILNNINNLCERGIKEARENGKTEA